MPRAARRTASSPPTAAAAAPDQPRDRASILRRSAPLLLLVVATLAAYAPVRHNAFVWDDAVYIRTNPHLRTFSWDNLRWMLFSAQGGDYQPLTYLTWTLDHALSAGAPWSFHASNVLLHTAAAVTFFFVARRLLAAARAIQPASMRATRLDLAALIAALLFALHPLRVEAVAWASNRAYVLPGLLALLTLYAWLRAHDPTTPHATHAPHAASWRRASLIFYACSLLATPIALTLPVLLLLLDVYPLRRLRLGAAPAAPPPLTLPRALLEKLPFFLLALAAGLIAVWGKARVGAVADLAALPLANRLLLALYSPAFYLGKMLLPTRLNPLDVVPIPFQPLTAHYLLPAGLTLLLTVALLLAARRTPALTSAWLAYLILLLPFSGIVHHGTQLTAERYTYFSALPFALLLGALLALLPQRRPARLVCSIVTPALLLALGALTVRQIAVWKNEESLWAHAIRLDPRCYVCHYNLGVARSMPADPAVEPRLELAAADFRRALEIHPAYVDAANNLGNVYQALGRPDEAEIQYRRALEVRPDFADALNNLGVVMFQRDRIQDAESFFRRAIDADPRHPLALAGLADCLAHDGRLDEALDQYRRAAEADPDYAYPRRSAANLLYEAGRIEEAVSDFQSLLHIDPRDAVSRNTLAIAYIRLRRFHDAIDTLRAGLVLDPANVPLAANLVRLLATCPDPALRDPAAAVALGERIAAGAAGERKATSAPAGRAATDSPGQRDPAAASGEGTAAGERGMAGDSGERTAVGERGMAGDPGERAAAGERGSAGDPGERAAAADDPQLLASLAIAYLRTGRPDESRATAQRAVAAALRAGQPDLAQRILDELNRLAAEP